MKQKIQITFIYLICIVVLTILAVQIGAWLITKYSMYTNGFTDSKRHLLADDMGFGFLLMLGLIPEILIGVISGLFLGNKINAKLSNT